MKRFYRVTVSSLFSKFKSLLTYVKEYYEESAIEQIARQQDKRYERTVKSAEKALKVAEKKLDSNDPDLCMFLEDLGTIYFRRKEYQKAALFFERSLTIAEKSSVPGDPCMVYPLVCLVSIVCNSGSAEMIESLYQQAIEIEQNANEFDPSLLAGLYYHLGAHYAHINRYEQAEHILRCSLSIVEKRLGPDHPQAQNSLSLLAAIYIRLGKHKMAEECCERHNIISEKTNDEDELISLGTGDSPEIRIRLLMFS